MAEAIDIRELNERIERQSAFVTNLMAGMDQVIVGQKHLVESLLIGLLSDGHILLEGVPGLAKTLAIKTLASLIDAKYSRIQFTPDLLPADVIGTMIYSQKDEQFIAKRGPIFANFVLADEINRAPAKVQSALLEGFYAHNPDFKIISSWGITGDDSIFNIVVMIAQIIVYYLLSVIVLKKKTILFPWNPQWHSPLGFPYSQGRLHQH